MLAELTPSGELKYTDDTRDNLAGAWKDSGITDQDAKDLKCNCTRFPHTYFIGMGKSYLVGQLIASFWRSVGMPASAINAAEAIHGDAGAIDPIRDKVIILSHSGESPEVVECMHRFNLRGLAIGGNPNSTIAKMADDYIYYTHEDEDNPLGIVPVGETLAMIEVGLNLLGRTITERGITRADYEHCHPGGKIGANFRTVEEAGLIWPPSLLSVYDHINNYNSYQSAKRVRGIAVGLNNNQAVSIYTDGDARRNMQPTVDPISIGPDCKIIDAINLCRDKQINALVVNNSAQGEFLGLVFLHDLLAGKKQEIKNV